MEITIQMVGLDFETAPIEMREALAFERDEIRRFLPALLEKTGLREAVLLSTCNRTELYSVPGEEGGGAGPEGKIMSFKGLVTAPELWMRKEGEEAVEHLFGVASGLRSMIRGEAQILGQVKEAFRTAVEAMTTGPVLNRVFHAAFRAGKRVRAETGISEGAVSVSQAAVELACEEVPKALVEETVLVIGAGEMAGLVVKHLVARGATRVRIANRTAARARDLADSHGFEGHGLDELGELIGKADIVISAASADDYLVSPRHVEGRKGRLYFVDIGIPRTLDPLLNEAEGCTLRNIDSLNGRVQGNLLKRQEEARRGAAIVREEVAEAMKWIAARKNISLIHSLAGYMEDLRARELRRACRGANPSEVEKLDKLATHIIKKITQPIIKKINDARAEGDQSTLEAYLNLLKEVYRI